MSNLGDLKNKVFSLFRKSKFINNILWNLSGFIVPLVSAVISIPIIMSNVGVERFGVFTLISVMIGFMNVFDFGLSRSITNSIVKHKINNDYEKIQGVIKSGIFIIISIAVLLCILIYIFKLEIVKNIFSVTDNIFNETLLSVSIISFTLPFVMLQSASVGILEGFGRFKEISLSKIPFATLMFAIPAMISLYTESLVTITLALCLLRVLMATSFWLLQRRIVKGYLQEYSAKESSIINIDVVFELLRYGGWISVSNFIAPIMLYIDRFFVASIAGASVLAYYTTPFEIVSKMSIIAVSVSSVLFPLLAGNIRTDTAKSQKLYIFSTLGIGFVLLFPVAIGLTFSNDVLTLWINEDFAKESWKVFSLFCFGFLIHGMVQPAYIWIQAEGKPHITALAHVFDFVLYMCYFPFFTKEYGIQGAAVAWVIRVSISFLVLHTIRYVLYRKIINEEDSYSRSV